MLYRCIVCLTFRLNSNYSSYYKKIVVRLILSYFVTALFAPKLLGQYHHLILVVKSLATILPTLQQVINEKDIPFYLPVYPRIYDT
jgi:hypothetical protein